MKKKEEQKKENKAFLKIQAEITKLLNENKINLSEAKELHSLNIVANEFKNPHFFINEELFNKKWVIKK